MRWLGKIAGSAGAGGAIACMTIVLGAVSAAAQTTAAPAAAPGSAPSTAAGEAPASAPAAAPEGLSESVVVTVNDDLISTYDIIQRMRLLIVTSGIQPTDANLPEIQREAVRSLVDERLEMQELKAQGKTQKFDLVASDSEVDDELADIARSNNTSASQLLANLAAQGVGAQTFRDQLRAEISWRGWIRGRYGQRLAIGEDQIKAFQKRLEAEAGKPQYQISEVFIDATRVGGMPAAEQGAAQLIGQIQKGAPFAAVARQFSNSPSAANGGDVGWISTGEMAPEVDQALENLRAGQLSAPILVKDGVYIIYLKDRRAGASANVVNLKQAAIALPKDATAAQVAAAQATLEALRPKLNGCDNLTAEAAKVDGVVSGDLGEAETKDLAPAFREAAETLAVGQVSAPIRTEVGLHLIAVCNKHKGGAQMMTHDQIESRLYGEELSMIAKRQLRDLHNSATIETR
jgi:peptidyl-prolyl cis-trans isomerase SurA